MSDVISVRLHLNRLSDETRGELAAVLWSLRLKFHKGRLVWGVRLCVAAEEGPLKFR